MKKLLAAGYFGSGNLGDDAILLGFIEGLKGTGHEVSALSGHPEETYRQYGISSTPRKDLARVKEAIAQNDALVFAGGSIFQDVTSVRSCLYYAGLVSQAKKQGKKVVMIGQGVGPLNTFFGKRAARSAFQAADAIVVRDPESARSLKALGVDKPVRIAADMAFLLPSLRAEQEGYQVGQMRSIGLIPRPHGKQGEVESLFAELSRLLFTNGYMPNLIELDRDHDGAVIQAIEKTQGGKIPSLRKIATPMELQNRLSRMDGVISMRLHGGILATTVGIAPLMLSYDPKVTAFAQEANLPAALPMNNLNAARVFDSFQSLMKQRESVTQRMLDRREHLRQQAQINLEVLQQIVR